MSMGILRTGVGLMVAIKGLGDTIKFTRPSLIFNGERCFAKKLRFSSFQRYFLVFLQQNLVSTIDQIFIEVGIYFT